MNQRDMFSDLIYDQQTHLAERELASFIAAVTELYGPAQARFAAEDWLEESDLMDSPPRSEIRDWRSVTLRHRLDSQVESNRPLPPQGKGVFRELFHFVSHLGS